MVIDVTLRKSSGSFRFRQECVECLSYEPASAQKEQFEMPQVGKLANDYIKVLAYRTSFSSASKVATLDDAHTLDLRPAFSLFWFEAFTSILRRRFEDAREQQ